MSILYRPLPRDIGFYNPRFNFPNYNYGVQQYDIKSGGVKSTYTGNNTKPKYKQLPNYGIGQTPYPKRNNPPKNKASFQSSVWI